MKILVVVAHPDDEVLGCGGTIAKHVQNGNEVYCLIMGEGVSSRYKRREMAKKEELKALKAEAKKAAEILGIKKVFFKDFPDNRFDTVPLLEIIKAIEEIKEEIKPDIIYTHYLGDLNVDHRITFEAVLTACRPLPRETTQEIYSFEVPSATEWNFQSKQFMPNVFVDISETFNRKIEALKAYRSEIREYPHPRSPESLEIVAKRWGLVVGGGLVEPFVLIRLIRR
ncbi:MAG: PIG-L deacetylase family protein [Candidatus Heimdallarchaeota archaeon]